MTNIWSFLVQTAAVSMTILILWAVKRLMREHFSPFWQYGIWSVAALRVFLPASMARSLLPSLMVWLEILKNKAETLMPTLYAPSSYCTPLQPIVPEHPFPVLIGVPQSITDWLFVIYIAGVLLFGLRYLWSYIRLRYALKNSPTASAEQLAQIAQICERYDLKSCRAVQAEGIESAFVCGVFSPVLALPVHREIDDKVLLHELLHLKYRDPAQTLFWCAIRCLHWCNPLVWLACDRIGNDMETLCDQRVLECLEGEARRDYGRILLDMANEKYARLPGTSSVSNGGRNIRRRIESLVRFKKFPGGMRMAYICMIILLAVPMLTGQAAGYEDDDYFTGNEEERTWAMALARIHRCPTYTSAIDTYAKAVMGQNYVFLATVTSLEEHPTLLAEMEKARKGDYWQAGIDGLAWAYTNMPYAIYDLTPQPDGSYTAILGIDGATPNVPGGEDYRDENGHRYEEGCLCIPIRVWEGENGWCAEETGPRQCVPGITGILGQGENPFANHTDFGTGTHFFYEGEYGRMEITQHTVYTIMPEPNVFPSWSVDGHYSRKEIGAPDFDAELQEKRYIHTIIHYESGREDLGKSGYAVKAVETEADRTFAFADQYIKKCAAEVIKADYWRKEELSPYYETDGSLLKLPMGYRAGIYWDGDLVAEVDLQEVAE
ncbi:MAG: hypothetical protein IJO51_09205 [Clostridia bacterium]|nr:hypothetical protein [Clostridia bacterium]